MTERAPPTIVVLAAPRSGSSWLGSMLRDTGVLGVCREWLTGLVYPTFQHRFPLPPAGAANAPAFRTALHVAGATPNGASAVKIVTSTLDALPALVAQWGFGDGSSDRWIDALFPRSVVVVLRRLDEIGQALSWWRARHTGEFVRPVAGEGSWPPYDFSSLQEALRESRQHSARLESAAAGLRGRAGIRMLDVNYEDLEESPAETIRAVAALAGIELPPSWSPRSEFAKQRDETTDRLRQRFLADLAVTQPSTLQPPPEGAEFPSKPPLVPDSGEGVLALGHRRFIGGEGAHWDAIGRLQFDFLVAAGLRPNHVLLDIACGSLRGGLHFIPYLDAGNYIGLDRLVDLIILGVAEELGVERFRAKRPRFLVNGRFDLSEIPAAPDFALAQSLFTHLTNDDIARVFAALAPHAKPTTRFFATFLPRGSNDAANPESSHSRLVFRQTPEELAALAAQAGWSMRLIGDWRHPRGQHIAEFVPAAR
ncbi:MAG: hypothetical protein JNM94_15310 [Phycisphaerae bacterium]|nr:hypothetical protein [Phycisphaerae bacterium]